MMRDVNGIIRESSVIFEKRSELFWDYKLVRVHDIGVPHPRPAVIRSWKPVGYHDRGMACQRAQNVKSYFFLVLSEGFSVFYPH